MGIVKKLKGAEVICEVLRQEGVSALFGHPGGAILPFYDALWSYRDKLRHVLVRHEQAAAHAADGYARITGQVGVCVATSGPGATNLVTGLMTAKTDSIPIVAITGQVARAALGTEAFQECDICSIAYSCTKKAFMVMSAQDLAAAVREAFHVAREGRPGPVLIDVPRDVQLELVDFEVPDAPPALPQRAAQPLEEATRRNLVKAAQLINEAQRPVIIAGHGVIHAGAYDELRQLAETAGIPVINTLLGLSSLPRNHPLSLGMLGMHGMYWCNKAVHEADLIVGVGMRFDDRVTGKASTFAPHARIIHVDIDPQQIGRNVPVEVPLLGDARAVLQELNPLVKHTPRPQWLNYLGQLKQEHHSLAIPESERLLAQHVMSDLNRLVEERPESIIVTGVGQHQMWAAQFLFMNGRNRFVSSGGQGAMGYEVPAALGAQMAEPNSPVWSVAGDGGFQMTLQELATITQENLPVKFVLMNNGYLGMVRQWQELFFNQHYQAVPISSPDYVKLCAAYGIPAVRVTNREEVMPALRQAAAYNGPFLIDCVIDPAVNLYPMVPPGGSLGDTMEDPLTNGHKPH